MDKATYLGNEVGKVGDSDFDGIILDSDNYEDKINHVEIPQAMPKRRNGALAEEEKALSRSEL